MLILRANVGRDGCMEAHSIPRLKCHVEAIKGFLFSLRDYG